MIPPASSSLILVVDDNAALRYAISRTLRKYGFTVIEAATGEEALAMSQSEHPDLVVLDVNLPDIHGFDVARQMKSTEATMHTPILHLSASAIRPENRIEGLASGADAYLVEPVEPGELVANIRALLRMRDAEAGLQRTTAMLGAVVEAAPLAIAVFGRDGDVRTWNPSAVRLFGISVEEVQSRSREDILAAGILPFDQELLQRLDRGESIPPIEYRYTRPDGRTIDVAMFTAPLSRAGSSGLLAMFEDISARKQFERERGEWLIREQDARREAEAANRLKDEFLATLSHELRTPLNAMLGWIRILQENVLDDDRRRHAMDVIERNARGQQQIVNDILEVSHIVRGQLRLDMQRVDLNTVVAAAVELVRPTAAAKRQTIDVHLGERPAIVSADAARMQQVLWNLLSNAMKYTPRDGRIEVHVALQPADVDVIVRDNGVGIAPETLPHIFERFRQGESGPTREYGGLGLGLAIVRHLTDMHGGSVRATSAGLDRGAAFVITLPLAEAMEVPAADSGVPAIS